MSSTSDIFGASLGSALAEPQNPITIRRFEIVLFPSTYQPPPYCCFLGKIQRRKFLGQGICPCVWCFARLQSVHKLTLFSRVWLIFSHLGKVSPPMAGLLLPGSGYGSCLSFPFIYKSLSPLRSLVHQGFLCPPLFASFIETYYFILPVFLLLTTGIKSSVSF